MKILKAILLIMLSASIIGILSIITFNIYNKKLEQKEDNKIVSKLEKLMPQNTLAVMENNENSILVVDSFSYIGILEIPSLDLKLPVLKEKAQNRKYTLYAYKNSSEKLILLSDNDYGLKKYFIKLREYDEIYFKNVRGQKKKYILTSVTNQNEEIDNLTENIIIKLTKYNSYLVLKGITEE